MAVDIRALRTYKSSCDSKFIYDTLIDLFRKSEEHFDIVNSFVKSLSEDIRANCSFASDVLQVMALAIEKFINGAHNSTNNFTQLLYLARLCGCARDPSFDEGGVYSTHESPEYLRSEDLKNALRRFFDETLVKIQNEKEDIAMDTANKIKYMAFTYVLDNDSTALNDFLRQLPHTSSGSTRGYGAGATCNCTALCKPQWEIPSLENVLLAKDKYGWTPLQWAVEVGAAKCISVIMERLSATNSKRIFKHVLHARELGDAPAVFMSVYKADLECIMAFLQGGADFTTACGGSGISILEYLVRLACEGILGATYFPIFQIVVKYMLERNPEFDLTAPLYILKRKDVNDADAVPEEERGVCEEGEGGPMAVATIRDDEGENSIYAPLSNSDDDDDDAIYRDDDIEIYIPGFTNINYRHSRGNENSDEKMFFGWVRKERHKTWVSRYHRLRNGEQWEDAHFTLLGIAVIKAAVEVVKFLLDLGANPKYRLPATRIGRGARGAPTCESGVQPGCAALIHTAVESQNYPSATRTDIVASLATIQLLLDAGADVNTAQEGTKETALMTAVKHSKAELVVMLLKNGADPTMRNSEGKTAADEVSRYDLELIELFGRSSRLQRLIEIIAAETEDTMNNDAGKDDNIEKSGKDKTVPEDVQCGICWDKERTVTLAPCGHRRFCKTCALKILSCVEDERKCPFCKTTVESYIIQLYD